MADEVGYAVCFRLRGDINFGGGIDPLPEYRSLLTGHKQADIQTITQCIAGVMETLIRRAPDQWYMFRRMWPSAPAPAGRPAATPVRA